MIKTFDRRLSIIQIVCSLALISNAEKLIIDTDAGVDDAIAILTLLRFEKFQPKDSALEVIGITCTFGNTNVENVEANVLKTLTIAGRADIPVYSGASNSFIDNEFSSDNFYGKDGFGDVEFHEKIIASIDRSMHAANAIVDMVKANSGNVSIITLGPLTNFATALSLEKNLRDHILKFYIMGGSIAGIGNIAPNREFNFAADPHSNWIVFNAAKEEQITLLPWETVLDTDLTKEWRQSVFAKIDSPYVKFLNNIETKRLRNQKSSIWTIADPMSVACLIKPKLVIAHVVKNVAAVTSGEASGAILVDYSEITGKLHNAKIIQQTDKALFKKLLYRYLTCDELPC